MDKVKSAFKKTATSLLLIVLVALGARMGFAWNQERKIPRDLIGPVSFEQETGSIAYSLATGKGFSSPFRRETGPTAWLTPVYPLLVAGVFRTFGILSAKSFFVVVFLNALFSSFACIPIFSVGKRMGGLGVASGAAWLWALYPNAVMMPFEWVWDASLAALLGAVLLWATLQLADSPQRASYWCAYGLLWGFTLMTNPSLGLLLPFLLGWAAFRSRRAAKLSVWKPALAAGIAILCCVPWTVRNYVVFHKFVPLRSNFPLELYIGNNNNYATRQFVWPPKITKERELLRYFRLGETAFMEEEQRKAMEFIRAHPGIAIKLIGEKFVSFWTGVAEPVQVFRTTDSLLIRTLIVCNTLAALGALLGIVVLFVKRNPYAGPAAIYPLVFPWLYYVTHPNLRYRHPIDPVILLLAAVAAASAWRLVGRTLVINESAAVETA
ncbi:MAG TPA: glycosyltransferase family 39 protein [Candidatus Acidoferrum sp.]